MEIELKGATFLLPTAPGYQEGKRAVISLKIDADSTVAATVDEKKGGAVTVSGITVNSYSVKTEDGDVLESGAHPDMSVTFGLVQVQYQKTGERVITADLADTAGNFVGPARLVAFRTFGSVWSVEEETVEPPDDTDDPGTGLTGRFWQNRELIGEAVDELLCAPYREPGRTAYGPGSGDAVPPPSIDDQQDYSARFTGRIKFPTAGQYQFGIEADDGFRLYLNGRTIMSYWKDNRDDLRSSGWITVTAGEVQTIWVEFFSNNQKTSSLKVHWKTPGSPTVWQYPPITVFYPTDGTDAPPAAAERPRQQLWRADDVQRYT